MEHKCPTVTGNVQSEPTKIRRPANAFMLYANHNRKKLSLLYPLESNTEISKRLGNNWNQLHFAEKMEYYDMARQVLAEHKRKHPDYVYNPKEARIRKAMREATRERTLGVAPMPSPRGARRSNAWSFGEEEQLMMTPSHAMRGIIGSPMCTSPGFPISTAGNGPFMQSMHYNNKHVHHVPHTTNTYMQPNSIPQLPPPSEIWHPYEDPLRNASTGPPYMMPSQLPPPRYQQASREIAPIMPPEKPKIEPDSFEDPAPHANENVPPNLEEEKMMNEPVFENKVDSIQPLIETGNVQQQSETFMPGAYGENLMTPQQQQQQQRGRYVEKNGDMKMKTENFARGHAPFPMAPPYGATPNPDHPYYKQYIRKYLENANYDFLDVMTETGDIFFYVTRPRSRPNQYDYVDANDVVLLRNFGTAHCDYDVEALNLSKK